MNETCLQRLCSWFLSNNVSQENYFSYTIPKELFSIKVVKEKFDGRKIIAIVSRITKKDKEF